LTETNALAYYAEEIITDLKLFKDISDSVFFPFPSRCQQQQQDSNPEPCNDNVSVQRPTNVLPPQANKPQSQFRGAVTPSIMTLSIKTFNIKTFSIKTFSIKTFSIKTFSIKTFSIKTFRIKTYSIKTFNIITLSIKTFSITIGKTQHSA
jgi:hypothetical protein